MYKDIFELIKGEEEAYKTMPVTVVEGYDWNMFKHIQMTILYKNSQYTTGNSDEKPFKNIIRPILNLQYRAEGFDVKDIELFVNERRNFFKSLLIRKYHNDKWARENELDEFIDDMVESYVDFGGALIKDINEEKPEVVPLQRIAFCDQTNMLSGTLGEKHYFAPDELRDMKKQGWNNTEELILLSENKKEQVLTPGKESRTPGKYIEVYEVHGIFPADWLNDGEERDENFIRQIQVVAFYTDSSNNKTGITLFSGKLNEHPYDQVIRDKIFGRALGMGGAEELFESQVWINYSVIHMKGMLDAASKIIYQTADTRFSIRNKLNNLNNNEILVHDDGKPIIQVNTNPVNLGVFDNAVREWEEHAKLTGAATESILGEQPKSGTPFALQQLITAESHSLHEYRKGKIATFLDRIYRELIIPYIAKEVSKGQEFLATLDLDELQAVADSLVINEANKMVKERILKGELISQEEIDSFKDKVREQFMKGGGKKFLKILKGELKDSPISVKVNIAGKQKYAGLVTDKLTNVFRTVIAAPQILTDPRMAKLFNLILESSGLEPLDLGVQPGNLQPPQPQPQVANQLPAQVTQ